MKLLNRISAATQAPPVYHALTSYPRAYIGHPDEPARPRRCLPAVLVALVLSCLASATAMAQSGPTFDSGLVNQNYTVGATIVNLTLPGASGGTGTLSYTLTPDVNTAIPGLTFDASAFTLAGTPTMPSAAALTYTVTDANNITDNLTFRVTVHSAPTLATGVPPLRYTVRQEVAVTLPIGSGGFGTLSYTLTRISSDPNAPVVGPGLTFYAEDRAIRGTPFRGFADNPADLIYTVLDANGGGTFADFTMRVFNLPELPPIGSQHYTVGTAVNLELSTAGGFPPLTYTLTSTSSIPGWMNLVTMDQTISAITGTPDAASTFELTVAVTDVNSIRTAQTFMVTVHSAPTFADATTIPNQEYTDGQEVALTLPEASGGGYGTLSYVLTRTDGAPGAQIEAPGLTAFNPETRIISGTTDGAYGTVTPANLRYTVWDANGASATRIDFTMRTVAAPTLPTIAAQNYTVGTAVNLALAVTSGGIAPLTYTLTPDASIPNGLSFNPGMATLTGTPDAANPAVVELTVTVTDTNGVTDVETFTVTVSNAPTFAETIDEQGYAIGESVALTLPVASNGAVTLTYTLVRTDGGSPTLPDGLTFNPNPAERSIEGSPSAGFGDSDGASMRYTATDTNGAVAGLTFTMSVFGINTATIDDQNYYTETAVNLMLPGASGGTGTLSYTLTPDASIPGLTFDPDTRTLAGTPITTNETAVTLTYTATDANGMTDNRIFMVTVYSALIFTDAPPDLNQLYTVGQEVAVTLPEGDGGRSTLSYTLMRPGHPVVVENAGLTFDAEARTITGTTGAVFGPADLVYTVWDANDVFATIDFTMRVVAAPTFGASIIAAQNYTASIDVNLALPAAGDGVDPLTYTLTPIPDGLSFNADPNTRTLAGIPPAERAPADLTYTVTDANGITATQTFTVTVFSAPTIAAIGEQVYTVGQEVTLTLPKASGAAPLSYTLARDDDATPTLPPGLVFNPMTPSIEGTPSEPFGGDSGGISMRYTATDANGGTGATTFTLRVFGFGTTTIDDQNYTIEVAVNLTLPAVGGGADQLVYTLEPTPTGLSFNADTDTRTLTGTPPAGSTDATLTYTVTDANA